MSATCFQQDQAGFSYDFRTTNDEDTHELVFQPINIKSCDWLEQELLKIGNTLSTVDTNWNDRVSCLTKLSQLISNEIIFSSKEHFDLMFDGLFEIRESLATQCTELRSAVVKEVCKFLNHLAVNYDNKITQSRRSNELSHTKSHSNDLNLDASDASKISDLMDYLVPYLLKRLYVSILAISHTTNITIRTIIKNVPIHKAIHAIIGATKDRNNTLRARSMEYLQLLLEVQDYHNYYILRLSPSVTNEEMSSMLALISECVMTGISDANATVRLISRRCVWSLDTFFKEQQIASLILSKTSAANQKRVLSEKSSYYPFMPSIGKGHKTDLLKLKGVDTHFKHNNNNVPNAASSSSTSSNSSNSCSGTNSDGIHSNGTHKGRLSKSKSQAMFGTHGLHGMNNSLNKKQGINKGGSGNNSASGIIANLAENAAGTRPKSALPSRKHRLELLKKKKREAARLLKKQKNSMMAGGNNGNDIGFETQIFVSKKSMSRPQTALGAASRVAISEELDGKKNYRKSKMAARKVSMFGAATRVAMPHAQSETLLQNDMQARVSKLDENESDIEMKGDERQDSGMVVEDANDGVETESLQLDTIVAQMDAVIMALVEDCNKWNQNENSNISSHRTQSSLSKTSLTQVEQTVQRLNEWFNSRTLPTDPFGSSSDANVGNTDNLAASTSMVSLRLCGMLDTLYNVLIGGDVANRDCSILWDVDANNNLMQHCNQCIINVINHLKLSSNANIADLTQILHKYFNLFTLMPQQYQAFYPTFSLYLRRIVETLSDLPNASLPRLLASLPQVSNTPTSLLWIQFANEYMHHTENKLMHHSHAHTFSLEQIEHLTNRILAPSIAHNVAYHAALRSPQCPMVSNILKLILNRHAHFFAPPTEATNSGLNENNLATSEADDSDIDMQNTRNRPDLSRRMAWSPNTIECLLSVVTDEWVRERLTQLYHQLQQLQQLQSLGAHNTPSTRPKTADTADTAQTAETAGMPHSSSLVSIPSPHTCSPSQGRPHALATSHVLNHASSLTEVNGEVCHASAQRNNNASQRNFCIAATPSLNMYLSPALGGDEDLTSFLPKRNNLYKQQLSFENPARYFASTYARTQPRMGYRKNGRKNGFVAALDAIASEGPSERLGSTGNDGNVGQAGYVPVVSATPPASGAYTPSKYSSEPRKHRARRSSMPLIESGMGGLDALGVLSGLGGLSGLIPSVANIANIANGVNGGNSLGAIGSFGAFDGFGAFDASASDDEDGAGVGVRFGRNGVLVGTGEENIPPNNGDKRGSRRCQTTYCNRSKRPSTLEAMGSHGVSKSVINGKRRHSEMMFEEQDQKLGSRVQNKFENYATGEHKHEFLSQESRLCELLFSHEAFDFGSDSDEMVLSRVLSVSRILFGVGGMGARGGKCVLSENDLSNIKEGMKELSHRLKSLKTKANTRKEIENDVVSVLEFCEKVLKSEYCMLHRNALRIIQAICWYFNNIFDKEGDLKRKRVEKVVRGLVCCFGESAPAESGELALDVITQFCNNVDVEHCLNVLVPIIKEIYDSNAKGRQMFAVLSIFDRLVVKMDKQWLDTNINQLTQLLIQTYSKHREPMRSLIYLAIIVDSTDFLNNYPRAKKIVEMTANEADFRDWVASHRKVS